MNFKILRDTLKKRGIILEDDCIYEVLESEDVYLISYQGNFTIDKIKKEVKL